MSEIPAPTYTEYALLVRAESAEFRIKRACKRLQLIIDNDALITPAGVDQIERIIKEMIP